MFLTMLCTSKEAYFFWEIPNILTFSGTTFGKLDLLPSSHVRGGIFPTHLDLLERAGLDHWTRTGVISLCTSDSLPRRQ
jgi:hypothetical protein